MSKTQRNAAVAMFCVTVILHILCPVTAEAQQSSYVIVSGGLFVIKTSSSITLATDNNLMLEDITPCSSATQYAPSYSCTATELSGAVGSLHVVYSSTSCAQTRSQPAPDVTVSQLSCAKSGLTVTSKILQRASTNRNLIVLSDQPTVLGGRLYRFTYWTQAKDAIGNTVTSPNQVMMDTRPVVSASIPAIQSAVTLVNLNSPIAFVQNGAPLLSLTANCDAGSKGNAVTLPHTGTGSDVQVKALPLASTSLADPTDPLQLLPAIPYLGRAVLCVQSSQLSNNTFTPVATAATTALQATAPSGGAGPVTSSLSPGACADNANPVACAQSNPVNWVFPSGTKLVAPLNAPTGKTDAGFYANINMVAGTGSKFAWGLDGKIAELQRRLIGNVSITWLSATANVGNNTSNISGQTYTDSVDWTLPISYDFRSWRGTIVFAPDFSTDKEFDRKNMLADTHVVWRPYWKKLAWNTALETGADATYASTKILRGFGERLDLQAGMETGGAIIDTTQKASSGTAAITVPAYDIVRIVPQLHALLEWKPVDGAGIGVFTFDETFKARYMIVTENTVQQYNIPAMGTTAATVGLNLRPVSGWKGYNSFVTTWFPPHSANAGLGITYTDGFNAPKFSRVNSVTVGLTVLF